MPYFYRYKEKRVSINNLRYYRSGDLRKLLKEKNNSNNNPFVLEIDRCYFPTSIAFNKACRVVKKAFENLERKG